MGAALSLNKEWNAHNLCIGKDMYLIDNSAVYEVEESKRINIDYAEEWKDKLWRFTLKGNSYVSKGK